MVGVLRHPRRPQTPRRHADTSPPVQVPAVVGMSVAKATTKLNHPDDNENDDCAPHLVGGAPL
jgi:hypothetical protein